MYAVEWCAAGNIGYEGRINIEKTEPLKPTGNIENCYVDADRNFAVFWDCHAALVLCVIFGSYTLFWIHIVELA